MFNTVARWGFLGVVALVLLQAVPYGHDHINPPAGTEPAWNSPQTRDLAVGACFDCHSDQTVWPWYSSVAPVSWLIERDVTSGRRRLNFSQWGAEQRGARDAAETVQRGSMPPFYYAVPLLHPSAQLSSEARQTLAQGLQATLGGSVGSSEGEGRRGREQ